MTKVLHVNEATLYYNGKSIPLKAVNGVITDFGEEPVEPLPSYFPDKVLFSVTVDKWDWRALLPDILIVSKRVSWFETLPKNWNGHFTRRQFMLMRRWMGLTTSLHRRERRRVRKRKAAKR